MTHKKQYYTVFFLSAILGCTLFLLTYGIRPLDVTYTDWLSGGDLAQHYLGWVYFRDTPWSVPLGMIKGLTDEHLSVIYTDSIPCFALFFKLLSPILPETFQYFGIWGILSFGLMAGCSSLLLYRFVDQKWGCIAGSVVFALSPYILQRMFYHTALAGQWIIILALDFFVYDIGKGNFSKKVLAWVGLFVLASLVHPYFLVILILFLLAFSVRVFLNSLQIRKFLVLILPPPAAALGMLALMGAFVGKASYEDGGLGIYSSNLNTFFNPAFCDSKMGILLSSQNKQLPVYGTGQYEGMGYLGLGIILLLLVDCAILILCRRQIFEMIRCHKRDIILLFLVFISLLVLALSPTITVGDHILVVIPWPKWIVRILSVFRASGRFVWGACYLVFLVALLIPMKFIQCKYISAVLITVCILFQLWDLSPSISTLRSKVSAVNLHISREIWTDLLSTHNKVVYLPYISTRMEPGLSYALTYLSASNGFDTEFSAFNTSRMNFDLLDGQMQKYIQQVLEGGAPDENLYVIDDEDFIPQLNQKLILYQIDEIIIGTSAPLDKRYADFLLSGT